MEDDLTGEEAAAYRLFNHYWRKRHPDYAISGLLFTILVERGFFGIRLQFCRFDSAMWLVTRAAYRRRLLELGPYRNI